MESWASTSIIDDTTVVDFERNGRRFILIGLPDHAQANLASVTTLLKGLDPDTLCLELCETRLKMLKDPDFWEEATIVRALRRGHGVMLLANLAAATYLHREGYQDPLQPGASLLETLTHSEENGIDVTLADRDLHVTLQRAWQPLKAGTKAKLVWRLLRHLAPWSSTSDETKEGNREIAHLSQALIDHVPELSVALIEESNQMLWSNIASSEGKTVAAVVDRSRLKGILDAASDEVDREALLQVESKAAWTNKWTWLFLLIFISMTAFGLSRGNDLPWGDMALAWILPNSILTAVCAAIGGGRFRSILAGFLVAPFTPLSPALRSGIVVGMVEAWLRKPVVRDTQTAPKDLRTIRGLYRNRLTRVLWVAWLAHAGSSIGNYAGAFMVWWVVG